MTLKFRSDAAGGAILNENDIEVLKIDASGVASTITGTVPLRNDYFEYTSTTVCTLKRDTVNGGRYIFINGDNRVIPSAGVTLSSTGLGVTTLTYVYAFMVGSTITLELSTAAPVMDTTFGIPIKTGDSTRTCVGMVYTTTTNQFAANFVISYANRRVKTAAGAYTAARSWGSTTPTELDSGGRSLWLHWGDEVVNIGIVGTSYNNTVGSWTTTQVSVNGGGGRATAQVQAVANYNTNASFTDAVKPVQGYNSLTLLCSIANGGTGFWNMQTFVTYRG